MLHIQKPKKVKDFYLANITDIKGKKVKLIISDCSWVGFQSLDQGGHVIRLWIPPKSDTADAIHDVDKEAYEQTLKNNTKWFPNSLSEEKINEFFRSSVHPQYSTFSILLSQWKPAVIYKDQEVHDKIDPGWNFKEYYLRIELEAEGICFFRHRFGVRWILRKMWLRKMDSEPDLQAGIADREELHAECIEEADEFCKKIDRDIEMFKLRIEELEQCKKKVTERLKNSETLEDSKWQIEIEELSKAMHKYSIGSWNYEHIQNFICHRI